MINFLSLEDYQIIENKKYKFNIYQELINSFFYDTNFNNIDKLQNRDLCNLSKYGLSSILLKNNFINNC